MKQTAATKCAALVLFALLLVSAAACAPQESVPVAPDKLDVCLFVAGNIDDKSFYESAYEGLTRLQAAFEDEVRTEALAFGEDESVYETALHEASQSGYEVIVCMGYIVGGMLQELAPQYPDVTYILLDSTVDYSAGDCGNVYCVQYKANEMSFLVGALAASMPDATGQPVDQIGFVGAIHAPVIDDFLVGYLEGALHVNPDILVSVDYVGDFYSVDTARALANAQFEAGVDIIFTPAAAASTGVFEAALSHNAKAVGVDSDQALVFESINPALSNVILTSARKNTGNSLYNAVRQYLNGTLPVGQAQMHGLEEGVLMLATNQYSDALLPDDVVATVRALEGQIIASELSVSSAYALTEQELQTLIAFAATARPVANAGV